MSAGYTVYLTVAGTADASFKATSPAAWAFYAFGFGLAGLAGLARNARRSMTWTVATALNGLLAVAVFVYPETFTTAQQTRVGWFENDGYVGLLTLALYLTIRNLRGKG